MKVQRQSTLDIMFFFQNSPPTHVPMRIMNHTELNYHLSTVVYRRQYGVLGIYREVKGTILGT